MTAVVTLRPGEKGCHYRSDVDLDWPDRLAPVEVWL